MLWRRESNPYSATTLLRRRRSAASALAKCTPTSTPSDFVDHGLDPDSGVGSGSLYPSGTSGTSGAVWELRARPGLSNLGDPLYVVRTTVGSGADHIGFLQVVSLLRAMPQAGEYVFPGAKAEQANQG